MNKLNKLLLPHIFIAFLIISLFTTVYFRSLYIITLHVGIITSLYITAFFISRIWKKQFKHISILIFSSLSTLLILLYIINFLSNYFWNDNVSLQFILVFLHDLSAVLEDIPYGTAILASLTIFIFIANFYLYKKYCPYLQVYDNTLGIQHTRIYILVTVATLIFFSQTFTPDNPGIWDGEPVTSLAIKSNTISHMVDEHKEIIFDKSSAKTNRQLQNVILIHADSIRASHMSSYGYKRNTTPFIDSLIKENAVQIKTGLSICSQSVCGIYSALTSKHVDSVNVDTPLIHSYLKQAGYRVVVSGSGHLSWDNIDTVILKDTDHVDRADHIKNIPLTDDSIILSTLSRMPHYDGVPTFFFLRYMSSHVAGRHYSQYMKYTPAIKNILTYLFPALDDPMITVNAYDNFTVQLDDMVRKSIELLEDKGYIENSIIIIYGDHGEALNEHGYYGHNHKLYQEEIHVPIIFAGNRLPAFKETEFATLDDILPTILDILSLPLPDDIDGVSLLKKYKKRYTYHDSRTSSVYAIVEKNESTLYKLMINTQLKQVWLFNLTQDPEEKHNLVNSNPEKVNELIKRLNTRFKLSWHQEK